MTTDRSDDSLSSAMGRPIEVHAFGSGRRTALVMAGVHGDETRGVEIVRLLLDRVAAMPEGALDGRRIVVMPLANPDGYALGTRKNANRIDLNRNFPTKDFGAHHTVFRDFGGSSGMGTGQSREVSGQDEPERDPDPGTFPHYGGETPASEPETQAIMAVISKCRPRLVISLHEPLGCVNYNGPSVRLAQRISKLTGLPVTGDIGYPCPGSMGTYYGFERRLPLITLELPKGEIDVAFYADVLLQALTQLPHFEAGNSFLMGFRRVWAIVLRVRQAVWGWKRRVV